MTTGFITPTGPAIRHRGAVVPLPATQQPLVEFVAALDICPECGGLVCDCITAEAMAALLARIDADPHGHNDLSGLEIPF